MKAAKGKSYYADIGWFSYWKFGDNHFSYPPRFSEFAIPPICAEWLYIIWTSVSQKCQVFYMSLNKIN